MEKNHNTHYSYVKFSGQPEGGENITYVRGLVPQSASDSAGGGQKFILPLPTFLCVGRWFLTPCTRFFRPCGLRGGRNRFSRGVEIVFDPLISTAQT